MFHTLEKIYTIDLANAGIKPITKNRLFKFIIANVLLFATPFIFNHPQIITGIIVNFLLIYIAVNYRKNYLLPAIFLPSIAALLNGVLFGSFTIYLLYFAPFIWISNALFILAIRYFLAKKMNSFYAIGISSFIKALFLTMIAVILIQTIHVPQIFLQAMSVLQFGTAFFAGLLFFSGQKLIPQYLK